MSTNTYAYNYDDIGNRLSSTSLVSSLSSVCNYSANALNQYTNISCSSSSTTQTPVYDSDGNMLSFNNWTFTWNAENRLIVASNATTIVHYVYDYAGRRFMKTVSENGLLTKDLQFVYDGYVQIVQEDQLQAGSKKQRVWDPSGALLMVRQNNTSYFTCLDGNKNISDYVDSNGSVVAHYEYSPFGQITSATGSLKDDFEYRFSSEYADNETALIYYNFRYYSPKLARWLSKDPIEEKGGLNLYLFVGNNSINWIDSNGFFIGDPTLASYAINSGYLQRNLKAVGNNIKSSSSQPSSPSLFHVDCGGLVTKCCSKIECSLEVHKRGDTCRKVGRDGCLVVCGIACIGASGGYFACYGICITYCEASVLAGCSSGEGICLGLCLTCPRK